MEALVWVAVKDADLDWDWVFRDAKVEDLQNRLGFLVTLPGDWRNRTVLRRPSRYSRGWSNCWNTLAYNGRTRFEPQ